jgi:hypothetical protein
VDLLVLPREPAAGSVVVEVVPGYVGQHSCSKVDARDPMLIEGTSCPLDYCPTIQAE